MRIPFNMKTTQTLRDFYGRIIGYIETDERTGDKVARDFYRRIVGYYSKKDNTTRDFYRRILGKGDILAALIMAENSKK